ncbi:hypothetical protein [Streptomyces sp. E5N91]|uniref:hypothetical protein n=1 Tax=Streptomyces sp. E5N91 TaxID=1851996 RepID=UPI000EF6023F|nr:hypothetical protein [Streptomyces sp. E5N91]
MIRLPDLPNSITRAKVLAALAALGLPGSVRYLELDYTDGLTVGLLAEDAKGRKVKVGDGPAIITVQIPFSAPEAKAQHYIGQPRWCCDRALLMLGDAHDADCPRGQ